MSKEDDEVYFINGVQATIEDEVSSSKKPNPLVEQPLENNLTPIEGLVGSNPTPGAIQASLPSDARHAARSTIVGVKRWV